jgi:hypothetical protein
MVKDYLLKVSMTGGNGRSANLSPSVPLFNPLPSPLFLLQESAKHHYSPIWHLIFSEETCTLSQTAYHESQNKKAPSKGLAGKGTEIHDLSFSVIAGGQIV